VIETKKGNSPIATQNRHGNSRIRRAEPRRTAAEPHQSTEERTALGKNRIGSAVNDRAASDPVTAAAVVMVLYITDSGPNSVRAVANLGAICKEHLQGNFRLEIIDVLQYPLRALADGIVVTPSLAKLSPLPAATVVGNLSDRSGVLRALGIVE
jgi:circadian clock protein KaiB